MARTPRTVRTEKRRIIFFQALKQGASVQAASKLAKMSRDSVYTWRHDEEAFKAEWEAALDERDSLVLEESYRRAVEGVSKPVYQGGKRVGYVQEYSDTLLIVEMKRRKLFVDKVAQEHTGPNGGPIEVRRIERVIVDPGNNTANSDGAGVPPAAAASAV